MARALLPREETATLCVLPWPGALVPAERLRAQREAARLLREAEERAARIVAEARAEAAALRARATEEGRAGAAAEASRITAALLRARAQAIEVLQPELIALATAMARRILGVELRARPELAVAIARRVLEGNRPGRSLRLRVNPEDASAEAEGYRALAANLGVRLRLVPDAGVARGGCCLDCEGSAVDGRVEVQLAGLVAALRAAPGSEEVVDGDSRG